MSVPAPSGVAMVRGLASRSASSRSRAPAASPSPKPHSVGLAEHQSRNRSSDFRRAANWRHRPGGRVEGQGAHPVREQVGVHGAQVAPVGPAEIAELLVADGRPQQVEVAGDVLGADVGQQVPALRDAGADQRPRPGGRVAEPGAVGPEEPGRGEGGVVLLAGEAGDRAAAVGPARVEADDVEAAAQLLREGVVGPDQVVDPVVARSAGAGSVAGRRTSARAMVRPRGRSWSRGTVAVAHWNVAGTPSPAQADQVSSGTGGPDPPGPPARAGAVGSSRAAAGRRAARRFTAGLLRWTMPRRSRSRPS